MRAELGFDPLASLTAPYRWLLPAAVVVLAAGLVACGGDGGGISGGIGGGKDGPAPNGAEFTGIEHGDEVASPFTVGMTAEGGEPGEGHFHILVDEPCVLARQTIPQGEGYHHYDGAESEAELDLEPGEHDLCLQVSDGQDRALEPSAGGTTADKTHEITITVK